MKEPKTGAQVRGSIQSGDSGDIRPGFDPGAAPMETDAEAGGHPVTPQEAAIALEDRAGLRPDRQRNFDVAMRDPETGGTTSQTGRLSPLIIIVVILVLIAVSLAIVAGLYR